MIARAAIGMAEAGVAAIAYMPDHAHLAASALFELQHEGALEGLEVIALDSGPSFAGPLDSTAAARALHDLGAGAVLTIGGDGTNRAVVQGWSDVPVVAISTGTNNAFPTMVEPTLAGQAAGLVASGRVALTDAAERAKVIRIEVDGGPDDLALIDAVLVDGRFVGARALADVATLRAALFSRTDPAAMGMCGLGGLLRVCDPADDHGVLSQFCPTDAASDTIALVRAPFAPGRYESIGVRDVSSVDLGVVVEWTGPAMLALDGERERALDDGCVARLSVERTGPWVINVARALSRTMHHRPSDGANHVS